MQGQCQTDMKLCVMWHLTLQQEFLECLLLLQQVLVISLQPLSSFVVG